MTLILGVGIAIALACLAVVYDVLVAPLPFNDPARLVFVSQSIPELANETPWSAANYLEFAAKQASLASVAAYEQNPATLGVGDRVTRVQTALVTPSIFATLGMAPLRGRAFTEGDLNGGTGAFVMEGGGTALISDALWHAVFGSSPDIVGNVVLLDGRSVEVVGVMRRSESFPANTDVWLPLVFGPLAKSDRGGFRLQVIGRMKSKRSLGGVNAELIGIGNGMRFQAPFLATLSLRANALHSHLVASSEIPLLLGLAATLVVLMSLVVSVALIGLARVLRRQRDVLIRLAVGAAPRQLITQSIGKNALFGLFAGLVGASIAPVIVAVTRLQAPTLVSNDLVGRRWLALFALAEVMGLFVAACIGIPEARLISRVVKITVTGNELVPPLSGKGRPRGVVDGVLGFQVALTAMLVMLGALLGQELRHVTKLDLGIDARNVLTLDVDLPSLRYPTPEAVESFVERSLQELKAMPGVATTATSLRVPILDPGGGVWLEAVATRSGPREWPKASMPEVTLNVISPEYFQALHLGLRSGRPFGAADGPDRVPVAIVSKEFVRRYLNGDESVDKTTIALSPWVTVHRSVVGVVENTFQGGITGEPDAAVYLPVAQLPLSRMNYVIRTLDGQGGQLMAAIRRLQGIDPLLSFGNASTLDERLGALLGPERLGAKGITSFALLSLVFTGIGLLSLTNYAIAQRYREIGIKRALGATETRVWLAFIARPIILCVVGLTVGSVAVTGLWRFARTILPSLSTALDVGSVSITVGVVAFVCLTSLAIAMLRANRIPLAELFRRN